MASNKGILATLHDEHEQVKETLEKMESTSTDDTEERQRLLTKLRGLIEPHMAGEEEVFYAAIKKAVEDDEAMATVLEGYEEHTHGKAGLKRLVEADPSTPGWNARLSVLKELVTHHIEEEEDELFELAQDKLDDENLEAIDREYKARSAKAREAMG